MASVIEVLGVLLLIACVVVASSRLLRDPLFGRGTWTTVLAVAVLFGLLSVFGTYSGVDVLGAKVNVRDLGPMIAGPVAGVGAVLMECLHMLLVLLLVRPFSVAQEIVAASAVPMIVANALGMAAFAIIISASLWIQKTEPIPEESGPGRPAEHDRPGPHHPESVRETGCERGGKGRGRIAADLIVGGDVGIAAEGRPEAVRGRIHLSSATGRPISPRTGPVLSETAGPVGFR